MVRIGLALGFLLALLAVGCGTADSPAAPPTVTQPTSTPAPESTPTPTPTSTAEPEPVAWDTRVDRLAVPALGIDSEVSGSHVVPDTSQAPPGCPAPPPGQETLTVPADGIATPEAALEGVENKAWIFGHSRWRGQPGLFHALQDINVGDELLIDGMDRGTGERVTGQRFAVEGIYLADKESGAELVGADRSSEPTVILQTSVRETGADARWLLDQEQVLSRASNVVDGDLGDPCKYLLLFVIAAAS
jgi:hypothetical protein